MGFLKSVGNFSMFMLDEYRRTLDVLEDLARQHCGEEDGRVKSGYVGANARALRQLARHRRVEIDFDDGDRQVVGRWVSKDEPVSL